MRHARNHDEGVGMVVVLFVILVVTGLSVVATATATRSLKSSARHVQFGQALDAGEAGIDQVLGRLQAAKYAGTLPATSPLTTTDATARTDLQALADAGGKCASPAIQTMAQGQYLSYRNNASDAVYSISWAPSCKLAKRTRVLKAEYLFSSYSPSSALLTGGNLTITGSFAIDQPATGAPGGIHTNANINVANNSLSLGTGGTLAASGACSLNPNIVATCGAPPVTIPPVSPRAVYNDNALLPKYAGSWFNLCDDGSIRTPAAGASTPCAATNPLYTGSSLGWTFDSASKKWVDGSTHVPGVYYVYHADADIGGGAPSSANETVIAESDGLGCSKNYGSITFNHLTLTPYITGLSLMAGKDLSTSSNSTIGTSTNPGIIAAGDQIDIATSSAGIWGAVQAEDQCKSGGVTGGINISGDTAQGVVVHWVGGMDTPLASIIRTTLFLEL